MYRVAQPVQKANSKLKLTVNTIVPSNFLAYNMKEYILDSRGI